MRFILHIGINKTGTSSLQKTFSENAAALRGLGVCYPETGRGGGAAHHDLSRALKGAAPETLGMTANWKEAFEVETAGYPTCLVSSEDFATHANPARATALFPPGETTVVIYLREHVRHLLSWYRQSIQSRTICLDFEEFARQYRKDFHPVLARWANVYGQSNVVVRQYDRATFQDGDICKDFIAHALPDAAHLLGRARAEANPSLAGNLLFLKLLLNITQAKEVLKGPIVSEVSALASLDPTFCGALPVSETTVARLRSLSRADRDALARDYGIVFIPPKGAIEGPASPDLTRLRSDIDLIRSEAAKRSFHIVPLIDRLLAGFAPGV